MIHVRQKVEIELVTKAILKGKAAWHSPVVSVQWVQDESLVGGIAAIASDPGLHAA